MTDCRFCMVIASDDNRELLHCDSDTVAFFDNFPSAPGHVLIVPTRHVGHVRDLARYEWWSLCDTAYRLIRHRGGDLTIGINDGPLAGQTIPHVHLHLIPRSVGDVPDPRGGVRWVLPETAAYWEGSS